MILITGATGTIGRALVRQLVAAGVEVRALVRDAHRGAALDVPYVVGDLDEPGSIRPRSTGSTGCS